MLRLGDNSQCENYGFAVETGPMTFVRVAVFENATALGVGRLTGPNVPVPSGKSALTSGQQKNGSRTRPLFPHAAVPTRERLEDFPFEPGTAHPRWTAITVRSSGSICRDLLQMPYLRRRNQTEDRFLPIQSGELTRGRSVGAGHGTFNRIRINESRSVERRTQRDCLVQTPRPVTPNVEFPNIDARFPKAARLHGRKMMKPASVRTRQSPENETEMRYRRGVDRSIRPTSPARVFQARAR